MAPPSPQPGLKRLGFVKDTATYVYGAAGTAEKLYKSVRSLAPSFIEPTLTQVEDKVASVAAPVVAKAQDASSSVLHQADSTVDYLLTTVDHTLSTSRKNVLDGLGSVKELHDTNVKTFSAATTQYYKYIQEIADWASVKLNPVTGGQAAVDALRSSVDKALALADPDAVAAKLTDAWTVFSTNPVVAKVLDTADPVTKPLFTSFYKLHDSLVSWGLYKRVVDTGVSTLSWATTLPPYKLGAQYVYPWVQPVADPALSRLSSSKVVNDTLQFWKPTAIAA
mmetsp:Transcript_23881/g.60821  ORF Transcript_23881/g.60821 Transcript_23881/m.60821 type:complete len:280 (-) Transcript_23881:888-1727(-)|eukprot:CAMPEP_0202865392 /NCGR_PEP_ID=MMETSP1391-20130828/5886_1 /ASSEMBLY_ACC=CAM_ASM_000867 /TAXON_ID=1034604 /ORGANISM="Chlamydomonas leiostraca, Strain SAG 11-49" /LENGTH=279 /DNA_ID=CAMNT_0049545233 /DNA_START=92 /DNA_END=931 /DNA_ORIENTATION=+